jgi:Zn-dependent M16 (insulinase) family peptidase
MQTAWTELKETMTALLPYALLVTLAWMFIQQQERLVTERLDTLRAEIHEQTAVLAAIRDQLRTSGLVVPPFPSRRSSDD